MTLAPESTLSDVREPETARRTHLGRLAALLVITIVVVAGATGWLGVRAGTVSTDTNGYKLTVVYPHVARSGWDVPWRVTVYHKGGFGQNDVTIAVSSHYFDIFDTQAWHPEPDTETATPKYYYLSFAPPPGDTLEASYDTYVQPTAQLGRRADVVVIVDNKQVARTSYRTWLVP